MAAAMMQLGDFRFGVATAAYQELTRTRTFRWGAQERLGRIPARQWLGAGDDSITLSGVIYPHFRGGLGQIQQMADQAGRGRPLELVDSLGNIWGRWCIEQIEEAVREFLPGGIPRKIEFNLKLAAYGEE